MKLNINRLVSNAKRIASITALTIKEKQPEICLAVGIVGGVTASVMACKATIKAQEIMDEHKKSVEQTEECIAKGDASVYSEEDKAKDLAIIYTRTIAKLAKTYGPSVILGVISIAALIGSNKISRDRNTALAATLASVQTSFNEYRKNVEKQNKDIATKAMFDEDVVIKTENGDTVISGKDSIKYSNIYSPYSRFWDASKQLGLSYGPRDDQAWLEMKEQEMTDRLRANGYLFLNDVYRELGLDESIEGQTVGWIFDFKDESRDDFVSFGTMLVERATEKGDTEKVFLLNFNVNGPILNDCAVRKLLHSGISAE